MKHSLLCLALVAFSLAVATATPTENVSFRVLPAPAKMVVDGKTGDWDLSGGIFATPADGRQRNCATFISQKVPTTMAAGKPYPVTITFLNTGTATWSAAEAYLLGVQTPEERAVRIEPRATRRKRRPRTARNLRVHRHPACNRHAHFPMANVARESRVVRRLHADC